MSCPRLPIRFSPSVLLFRPYGVEGSVGVASVVVDSGVIMHSFCYVKCKELMQAKEEESLEFGISNDDYAVLIMERFVPLWQQKINVRRKRLQGYQGQYGKATDIEIGEA
ncbi:hypothetical protein VNO80_07136 [Phaseolus coccineus]|uniref:Uncharacterized protein n=1 Tax=Phaseolus coccineus TaxID=3886 RepID=A0AAN9NJJ9_PHACN